MADKSFDKHPVRTLMAFLAAGSLISVSALLVLLTLIDVYAGVRYDPSVLNFYPLMAGVGALFGFERWWSYESGGTNPFHDR